jgi:hypothetical protein
LYPTDVAALDAAFNGSVPVDAFSSTPFVGLAMLDDFPALPGALPAPSQTPTLTASTLIGDLPTMPLTVAGTVLVKDGDSLALGSIPLSSLGRAILAAGTGQTVRDLLGAVSVTTTTATDLVGLLAGNGDAVYAVALGTTLQVLRVNAAGTALEFAAPAVGARYAGFIASPTATDYVLDPFTATSTSRLTIPAISLGAGTLTAQIRVDGVAVTGWDAIAVTTSPQSVTLGSAVTWAAGAEVVLRLSAISGATGFRFSIPSEV